jgi:copper chaperone
MSQVKARFATSGMHCTSCSLLVDLTLSEIDGVLESTTDHVNGLSVVTYEDSVVTPEQIIAAIQSAGYEAEQL